MKNTRTTFIEIFADMREFLHNSTDGPVNMDSVSDEQLASMFMDFLADREMKVITATPGNELDDQMIVTLVAHLRAPIPNNSQTDAAISLLASLLVGMERYNFPVPRSRVSEVASLIGETMTAIAMAEQVIRN